MGLSNAIIQSKQFFIAGAGRSGISAAKILKKHGAQVFVTEAMHLPVEIQQELCAWEIPFEHGGHSFEKIRNHCNILVLSPGISLASTLALFCKTNHIPLVSEIEVASWFLGSHTLCCGVTGTNGKSTTVNYLDQLLLRAQFQSKACGNLGTPFSHVLMEIPESTKPVFYCIELSSYQLETTYSLEPYCSVFLNIQHDHVLRYGNITEYLKAKWRLLLLTKEEGLVILERNLVKKALELGLSFPKCQIIVIELKHDFFDSKKSQQYDFSLFENLVCAKHLPCLTYQKLSTLPEEQLFPEAMFDSAFVDFKENREDFDIIIKTKSGVKSWKITHSVLLGRHNILNILAASLIAARLGVSDDIILSQWEMASSFYKHLPHRLEKIASGPSIFVDHFLKEKKILIVNDSKATNMESTRVAVESFRQPVRLLLGGEPKGDSSFILQKFLNLHLVKIYPFGKAADKIQEDFKNFRNCISDSAQNMLAAANKALNESHENDVILLSPGCSSFDEFKNFEHRGDVFRKWAISHLKENNT